MQRKYPIQAITSMLGTVLFLLACTPQPEKICTREYAPVCVDGSSQYSNLCLAQAAGFFGDCASKVVDGECRNRNEAELPQGLNCKSNEIFSELGHCVEKPWYNFSSCAEEARQGACADGADPNPWVAQHCAITCARMNN